MGTEKVMPIDLHHAAGESSAGELTQSEQAAFAQLAAEDPTLHDECEFWRTLRTGLTTPPPDPSLAPGPHFPATIWQRQSWYNDLRSPPRAVIVPLPRWMGFSIAAGLLITIGAVFSNVMFRPAVATQNPVVVADVTPAIKATTNDTNAALVYSDDGGSLISPSVEHVNWANYMPLSKIKVVDEGISKQHAATHRPWLGLWTKPVECISKDGKTTGNGHLDDSVASNGPADDAGIEPGDVIRAIDGVEVATPHCIADHLIKHRPGDDLLIRYWSNKTASISEVKVTLGCVCQ